MVTAKRVPVTGATPTEQGVRVTALRCALEYTHYAFEAGQYPTVDDVLRYASQMETYLLSDIGEPGTPAELRVGVVSQ